jgi:hypothetical protein
MCKGMVASRVGGHRSERQERGWSVPADLVPDTAPMLLTRAVGNASAGAFARKRCQAPG